MVHGGRLLAQVLIGVMLVSGTSVSLATATATATTVKKPAVKKKARKQRPLGTLKLAVLSGRADLVSAGDALVQVVVPARVRAPTLRVTAAGKDVTGSFALRADGRRTARLEDLALGPIRLVARAKRARSAVLTITNHPNGGPVFSGPQVPTWRCHAAAVDRQCNAPVRYDFFYQPSGGRDFRSYDPAHPPRDVGTTTTDGGVRVPFIIRSETGYQNRDQYQITTLFQPGRPWEPWAPQPQFNHKLLITHGSGCGVEYQVGNAPSTTLDTALTDRGTIGKSPTVALARGFAVLSTALDNSGHNCNVVTQAESLVMAKERFVERYGELRYTIGMGCSGGSMALQQVANAYPGIYQGIVPQCSFPDAWSTGSQLFDLHVLRRYVEFPERWGPGVIWEPLSIAAVDGHPVHASAILQDQLYLSGLGDPAARCLGTTAADRWSFQNPTGIRCTLADSAVNVLGRRPADGYAGRPLDNVGVQYGLDALHQGLIGPAQFADLNAKIGGADVNNVPTAARTAADEPALRNAYRSGGINDTRQLDQVPIIDLRGSDEGLLHDVFRSFALRARLDRAHGTHANQVIWQGPVPTLGGFDFTTRGVLAMDRWLTAIERDTSGGPLAAKVIKDKPADIHDSCEAAAGFETPEGGCPIFARAYKSPRMVAGDSIATTTNKCRLRPLLRTDYGVRFTDAQWAQLQSAFPTGVCDFSKPGEDEVASVPWMTYASAVGGAPLGPAPASAP
ncbi:MAG: hypothetical protein JWO02_3057 [Solirubrobacterales bacterium]|nr:hypothetical protein [Solirubrobacterales bacterium]